MRRSLFLDLVLVGIALVLLASAASAASADPGPFRRTTPWAFLGHDVGGLIVGMPTGRAWGIESGLRPLDGAGQVALAVAVDDPDVAEAFVRVASYARGMPARGSSRRATCDCVHVGEDRRIVVELDPPPGAVAYRVRVLGRLVAVRRSHAPARSASGRTSERPTEAVRGPRSRASGPTSHDILWPLRHVGGDVWPRSRSTT